MERYGTKRTGDGEPNQTIPRSTYEDARVGLSFALIYVRDQFTYVLILLIYHLLILVLFISALLPVDPTISGLSLLNKNNNCYLYSLFIGN